MFISNALAQTAPAPTATGSAFDSMNFGLIALMLVIMYFVVLRPQQKRQKEIKVMMEALVKGDEIVIAGGILGRITKLGETYLNIEVANNTEILVQRTAVVQVLPKGTFKI